MLECRTPEREVGGSIPTAAVLCPWARHFTPRKYWLITQEAVALSRHDWKIVDWDIKPQHKQTKQTLPHHNRQRYQTISLPHHKRQRYQTISLRHHSRQRYPTISLPHLPHHNRLRQYCKFPKYSDTTKICCNHSKIWTMWLYYRVISPNNADGMANSVDPDQTGAVWSGSALFAQAYLSENLGSLR